MKGPDLTNSLVGVLLRFRKGKVAAIADVEAMFYQIRVAPHDRDALRFFWWPHGKYDLPPKIYRMTVHIFGAKSSPSCATLCLRQTAREFGKFYDPWLVNMVLNNFYVDDCLISVNATEDAITMVKDLRSLLAKGGFRLTKWLSTSHGVKKTIPDEEKSKSVQGNMPSVGVRQNVLGVSWDMITDEFYFNVDVSDARCTKRKMLSVINSLYDPLGFVTPVVLKARLLYSEAC